MNDYALLAALITGSFACYWIDRIPLWGTKIPLYGYCSTVVFTETNYELSIWANYLTLLFFKGVIYLCLFMVFMRMMVSRQTVVGGIRL